MSRHHQFVHELESTADHIADASRADLQVMLRRAALLLRNVGGISLDARTDDALAADEIPSGRRRRPSPPFTPTGASAAL
jgi:hypothetical protein